MKFKSDIEVQAGLKDSSGSSGTAGQILSSSGTTVSWSTADPTSASGTTNYVSKFTGTTTLGNSQIFDNGTNVGIGTTSPGAKLQVKGSDGYLKFDSNGDNGFIKSDFNLDLYADDTANNSSAYSNIRFFTYGASEKMRITSAGNVGIGTTAPTYKLQVASGDILADQSVAKISLGPQGTSGDVHFGSSGLAAPTTGSQDYGFYAAHNAYRDSTGVWKHSRTSTIPAVRLLGSGGVSSGNSGFSFDYSANTGAGGIAWTNLMQIATSGNVGIGTTNPGAKLEVAGGRIAVDSNFGFQLALTSATQIGRWFNSSGTNYLQGDGGRNWQIGSSTNGVNTHFDNANNRVGIGTTSPGDNLQLNVANGKGITVSYTGITDGEGSSLSFKYGGNNTYTSAQVSSIKRAGGGGDLVLSSGNTVSSYSEIMRLTKEGNVGIGTTSPDVKLEVIDASPTDGIIADFVNSTNAGGTTAAIKLSNADSDVCDVVLGANRIGANFGSDFFISPSDGVDGTNRERFRITEAGAIKFNAYDSTNQTGTPTYLLGTDASGNIVKTNTVPGSAAGPYLPLTAGASYPLTGDLYLNNATYIRSTDSNGAVPRMFGINPSNSTYIGPIDAYAGGSIFYGVSANVSAQTFYTGASARMHINSSGNVGIGTTSPAQKLHVDGAIVSGNITEGVLLTSATGVGRVLGVDAGFNSWNDLDIRATSATQLYLSTSGNVGIGTTSPSEALDVNGNITIKNNGFIYDKTGNPRIKFWEPGNNSYYAGTSSGGHSFYAVSGGALMTILSSGNVGIGTTSPGSKLTVNGDARLANSGKLYLWNDHSINYLDYRTWVASSSTGMTIQNSAAGGNILLIPNGNVGIGTTSPGAKLEVSSTGNTAVRISTDGDAGDIPMLQLYRSGSSYGQMHYEASGGGSSGLHLTDFRNDTNSHIIFNTRGANERMRIEGDGNVGIGTTAPSQKLHVEGNARITGAYYDSNNSAGTSGQVLSAADAGTNWGWIRNTLTSNFQHTSNSSLAYYFMPFSGDIEITTNQWYNNFTAAYAGRIRKIILKNTNGGTAPTATNTTFRVTKNGSTLYTSGGQTTTAGYNMYAAATLGDSNATFAGGDRLQVSFNANGTWQNAAASIIIEYTEN
jgi:hypothetical protein